MIEYLEHHIVDHCNLKCAGCSHFSSIADEWFEDLEDFKKDFNELSNKTNQQVKTIRIMGGEPLLHPQVSLFLENARIYFPNSEIQLVTNGILINQKKEELVKICNENKIRVCVSNYGLKINLKELLRGFNLTRIDSKNLMYNICLDTTGEMNPEQAFSRCDLHICHWYYFQNGRFYPCCISANIKYFNKKFEYNLDNEEELNSISIYKHTEEEILNFLNKPIPLCKYCNTTLRQHAHHSFYVSNGDIEEWTYQ